MDRQIAAHPWSGNLVNNKKEWITSIHNGVNLQTSQWVHKARHRRHHSMWYRVCEILGKINRICSDGKQMSPQGPVLTEKGLRNLLEWWKAWSSSRLPLLVRRCDIWPDTWECVHFIDRTLQKVNSLKTKPNGHFLFCWVHSTFFFKILFIYF